MAFKVGDVVVGKGPVDGVNIKGRIGVVVSASKDLYGVNFDKAHDSFHSASGSAPNGHGWWCAETQLELLGGLENE